MVSDTILGNQQNAIAGRALLEGISHGLDSELQGTKYFNAKTTDEGKALQGKTALGTGDHKSFFQHSVLADETQASDCSPIGTLKQFQERCEKLAEFVELCSEGCFDVIRRNYLAGALPSDETN
jgi:hypothetical protein